MVLLRAGEFVFTWSFTLLLLLVRGVHAERPPSAVPSYCAWQPFFTIIFQPLTTHPSPPGPGSSSCCSDLRHIVCSVGVNVTEEQVELMLKKVQEAGHVDEETTAVRLDNFLDVVPRMLVEHANQYVRDSYHKIMRAFGALDLQGRGWITPEDYASALRSEESGGKGLSEDEIEQALLAATNPNDGKIHYMEYAYKLAYDGRNM